MPRLRPLFPVPKDSRPDIPRESRREVVAKRRNATLACEGCRQRKTRCDGTWPTCNTCTVRGQVCWYRKSPRIGQHYEQSRQQESACAELFELLRVMPEGSAAEVLRRLRAGTDATSILSQVKNGYLLIQLSLKGGTRRRYEFPYSLAMPVHLSMADNPYLDSILYRATFSQPTTRGRALTGDGGAQEVNNNDLIARQQPFHGDSRHSANHEPSYHVTYSVPYHAARMVEPIVDKIEATPWTRVIFDNRLFRRLICSYFYYPHPCGPFVHKDLLLEDMAAGQTRFCSPLLVNAILSIASVSVLLP